MKRLTQWSVKHRWAVIILWIAVIAGLAVGVVSAGSAFEESPEVPDAESIQAIELLAEAGVMDPNVSSGNIAWQTSGSVTDLEVQNQVSDTLAQVQGLEGVLQVNNPYEQPDSPQINSAKNTAFATITVDDADPELVFEILDSQSTDFVTFTAGGSAFAETPGVGGGVEAIGILAAMVILFIVFKSVWGALLPLITGISGVAVSLLTVILLSHVTSLPSQSVTMAAFIGLAVGIDYALLIVNRYLKALRSQRTVPEAIQIAMGTSGKSVIFAGLTVALALIAIFVVNLGILTTMGQAAALTVICTVLAATTLLPALLSVLGYRVLPKKQRSSYLHGDDLNQFGPTHKLSRTWANVVTKRPLLTIVGTLVVAGILCLPVLQLWVGAHDDSAEPKGSHARDYYDMMSASFGDGFDSAIILAADTPDAESYSAFANTVDVISAYPGVAAVVPVVMDANSPTNFATVIPTETSQSKATWNLVREIRDDTVPQLTEGTNAQVLVGGKTATNLDISDALMSKLGVYLLVIALMGFILMALVFRSLLVPLVGTITNLITVGIGLGATVAVFQFGWGSELIGVGPGAPIIYIIPVLIVGVMCGLSMDYQVFLVSRMKEEWTTTRQNGRAIQVGQTETARVIAAAALIMLSIFVGFGLSGQRIIACLGIGLATAVLADAFLMRLTLVPAVMKVLGKANWYYPRWLQKITPDLDIEGAKTFKPLTAEDALKEHQPV